MSLQAYVGFFVKRSGTGTQAITGVGFQPKVLRFWTVNMSAHGFVDSGMRFSEGYSDGTSHRCIAHHAADNATPCECSRGWSNAAAIRLVNLDGSLESEGVVDSMDADGFTFDWTTAVGSVGSHIHFLALGGAELEYAIGDLALTTSTGNQSVTGLSFAPTAVLFFLAGWTTSDTSLVVDNFGGIAMGWLTAGGQGALATDPNMADIAGGNQEDMRAQVSTACIGRVRYTDPSYINRLASGTLTADGFTLNSSVAIQAGRLAYLALGGISAKAGVFTTDDSSVVTSGMTPQALLVMSVGRAQSTSVQIDGAGISLGTTDGTNQHTVYTGQSTAKTPSEGARYDSITDLATLATPATNGLASTVNARAVFDAFSPIGFSVTWPTVDATERELLYLALGTESIAPADCVAEVDYEAPCVPDQEPWIALQVVDDGDVSPEDETTYLAAGVLRPINDSEAAGSQYGSRKDPCVVDFGTVRREASDYLTGNWPAQSQSLALDDADHRWRGRRELHGGDFKQARFWQYLTSAAHRQASGIPRLLFQGLVESDSLSEKLGFRFPVNDILGNAYQLHTNEVMIPQRVIPGVNNSAGDPVDFPGFIDPDVRNPRAVPIVLPYTDAVLSPSGGAGQAICLGDFTCADASVCVAGLISGHAHKDGIEDLFDIDGIITSYDTDVWAPGKGSDWSVKNPSGSALKTTINGNDYTLFFTNGARGAAFKDGSKPIWFNVKGPDTAADGTGTEMKDAFTLKKWLWLNHLLPTPPYRSGAWLPSPTFDFYPGGQQMCRVDTASFDRNSILATLYNPGGYVWAGIIGAGGQQQPIRDVIAAMNRSSNSLTTWNEFSQISDVMLDRRRGTFVKAGILDAVKKSGIQKDPPFTVEPRPAWHMTNLHTLYAWSEREGKFIADLQIGSNAEPFLKYGAISKTLELPFVGDTATAAAISQQVMDLCEELPQVVRWTRTWCGLEDQVGDGRALTIDKGSGQVGYVDNGFWIIAQDYQINRGRVVSYGIDVERVLYANEAPGGLGPFQSMTVDGTAPGEDFSTQFHAIAHYSGGDVDVTGIATWASDTPSVATVNSAGLVSGVAAGSASITATYGLIGTASLAIVVVSVTLSEVRITGAAPLVSATSQLTATAIWSDGSQTNITSTAAWVSTDTAVFTVGAATGLTSGVGAGTAQVRATSGAITGSATLVVTASAPAGTVYEVAPWGLNTNTGSSGSPWRTIGYAVSRLAAGDTLYIRLGTYTGIENVIDNALTSVLSGTSWSTPVTIAAYPGEAVTLQPPNSYGAISLQGNVATAQYIIFKDFTCDGINNSNNAVDTLVYVSGGANHIRFQNLEVMRSWEHGFQFSNNNGDCPFLHVTGCRIHDNGRHPSPDHQLHGLYAFTSDLLIEGNDAYANAGYGFHIYNSSGPLDADRCIIRRNRIHDNNTDIVSFGAGFGMNFAWGSDCEAYDNLVWGNRGGIQIYSNSFGAKVYNNTIYDNTDAGISLQYYGSAPIIKNNILYGNGATIQDLGGTGTPVQSNNTTADPSFVNAAAANFHLQVGSVARDAGVTVAEVTTDYDGVTLDGTPDTGAYQYV